MKTEYKKELGKSYLVVKPEQKEHVFSAQMLLENRIQGLLSFEKRSFNGETEYYYDITGKRSLESRARKELLGEKDVRRLLQGLYCVTGELYSYFLETDGLLPEPACIYEEEEQFFFCYDPSGKEETEQGAAKLFAQELLELINHDDEEAVELTYSFYKLVNESEKGILRILEEVLMQEKEDSAEDLCEEQQEVLSLWYDEDAEEPKMTLFTKRDRPDLWTVVLFLVSLLVSLGYLVALTLARIADTGTGILAGLFLIISATGMAAGFVDIDIARKK